MWIKRLYERVFKSGLWILSLNPVFLLLIFLKYIDYRYEDAIYQTIVNRNMVKGNPRQTFQNLVSSTFELQLKRRINIDDLDGMNPFKSRWMRSGDMQLLDGRGACGNYAHILAELCQKAGYDVRIAQLSNNGQFGSHIIVETKVGGEWAAADALFKLLYYHGDSTFASIADISKNPTFFQKYMPPDYPYKNSFHTYRYTNWNKVPILMPALRTILVATMGERWTFELSLRTYVLNMHKAWFVGLVILYLPVFAYTARKLYLFASQPSH